MSRGLSRQQRRILGIAVGIFDAGMPRNLVDAGFPHVWKTLVLQLVYGLPLTDRATDPRPKDALPIIDSRTAGYASACASAQRALQNLVDRGLLVREGTHFFYGYFLTGQGEREGRPHREELHEDVVMEASSLRQFLVLPGDPDPVGEMPKADAGRQVTLYGRREPARAYGNSVEYLVRRLLRQRVWRDMLYGAPIAEPHQGRTAWGLRVPAEECVTAPDVVRFDNAYEGAHVGG